MDQGLGQPPKKLLIAEDDFYIRDLYKIEAKSKGFVVYTAGDGEEALSICKVSTPDIIMLDIMMPKISGLDVLKTLRSWDNYKNTPILLFTNVGDPSVREEAKRAGATDILLKVDHSPIEMISLLSQYLKTA